MFKKVKLVALLGLLPLLLSFGDDAPLKIRMAAANITSGRHQSYDPGHGIRIFQAAKPDIVMIQEMNYKSNTPENMRTFVTEAFGENFDYYRESHEKKNYKIPNGIISRYPIEDKGSWTSPLMPDRGYAWAKIKLPDGQFIYAISVHLSSKSSKNRAIEADEIVRMIKKNFPPDALLVIGGDFNTKSDNEECLKIIRDGKITKEDHTPKKGDGSSSSTNATGRWRYDWLLASPSLDKFHVDLELYTGKTPENQPVTFKGGLVFDTRKLKPLPEPAKEEDSAAENMQHMMVLKDFVVPVATQHQKKTRVPVEDEEIH